jgi:hypothetical protein
MNLSEASTEGIERALARASASRTTYIAQLPDNPLGIHARTLRDGLEARVVRRELAYYRFFSGPLEFRSDLPDETIVELAAWYREYGAQCYIRVAPKLANRRILAVLSAAGLRQSDSTTVLVGAQMQSSVGHRWV